MSKNIIYNNKKQIAENIKVIRNYLGLSKTELAEKTGIGRRALEFETGRFLPTEYELNKIANLSDLDIDQLIFFELKLGLFIVRVLSSPKDSKI